MCGKVNDENKKHLKNEDDKRKIKHDNLDNEKEQLRKYKKKGKKPICDVITLMMNKKNI